MSLPNPESLQWQRVYESFHTNEHEVEETIKNLKEWLTTQPHLPQNVDEIFLRRFAIGIKKGFEDCTRRLDLYYSAKNEIPFLSLRDPKLERLKEIHQSMGMGFMPGVTPDSSKVLVLKLLDFDADKYKIFEGMSWSFMLLDALTRTEISAGYYCIVDCAGSTVQHYLKVQPRTIAHALSYSQNIYPVKVNGIIFFNLPYFGKVFIANAFLPFLSKKISSRVHLFSGYPEQPEQLLPLEFIPSDMCGLGMSVKEVSDLWTEKLESSEREWLLNEGSLKSDESKRIGKSPFSSTTCSVM